jgi:hypothetical protein
MHNISINVIDLDACIGDVFQNRLYLLVVSGSGGFVGDSFVIDIDAVFSDIHRKPRFASQNYKHMWLVLYNISLLDFRRDNLGFTIASKMENRAIFY